MAAISSHTNVCRLCLSLCGSDSRSLYHETGQINEIYEITVKYFHPMFLDVDQGNNYTVMCSQCWHHISNFYTYQQSVFEAQRKLLLDDSEIQIQSEECVGSFSSENTNGDNTVIKYEDDLVSLPDLELMEDLSYDDNAQYSEDLESSESMVLILENGSPNVNLTNSHDTPSNTCKSDFNEKESQQYTEQFKMISRRKRLELDRKIAQWRPILECEICGESLASFTLMQQHFRLEHPGEQCYISCCGRTFNLRSRIEEHARFHLDPNAFCCPLCDARQGSRASLYMHNRIYHSFSSKQSVISKKCELKMRSCRTKKSFTKTPLDQIERFIAQYMPNIECALCNESCSSFTLLKCHFAQHHPGDECYVLCCQRKFINRSTLKEHIKIHLDPDVFKCKECGKNNSSYKNLQTHSIRMHSTFENTVVQNNSTQRKRPRERKSFKAYDAIIAQWKPNLECVVCRISCASYSRLQAHFRKEHSNDEFYILCCHRKLNTRPAVMEHIQLHRNPNAFKCHLCDKCYLYQKSYQEHMRFQHPGLDIRCLGDTLYGNAKCDSMA